MAASGSEVAWTDVLAWALEGSPDSPAPGPPGAAERVEAGAGARAEAWGEPFQADRDSRAARVGGGGDDLLAAIFALHPGFVYIGLGRGLATWRCPRGHGNRSQLRTILGGPAAEPPRCLTCIGRDEIIEQTLHVLGIREVAPAASRKIPSLWACRAGHTFTAVRHRILRRCSTELCPTCRRLRK